ncbi:hypothetical protein HGI09_33260 [Streptomyces collinus]|nr:hypothetical protein HGI10_30860 [Streptomyces collinus]UJA15990.1 hypothetical protein HGI09_33260 [Streptomyces collinus]
MRARYMHVTGIMLRKVAPQVGEALWEAAGPEEKTNWDGNRDGERRRAPPRTVGSFDIVPGEALAEDTRFELVRGCPQHAFQACALGL